MEKICDMFFLNYYKTEKLGIILKIWEIGIKNKDIYILKEKEWTER